MKRQVRAGFHDPSPVTRTVVLSLFFSCSLLVSAEGPDYGSVLKEELIQRESKVDSVEPLMADAISLRDAGKFKEAVAKCDAALSKLAQMNLGDGPSVVARKSMILQLKMEIRSQWGKSLILQAKQLMQKGYSQAKTDQASSTANIQKAIELAREAKREAPETLDAADEIIQLGDKVIKSNKFIQETSLSVIDPDNTSRKEQIAIHLREAQIFYKSRQYSRARDVLEQALVLDPYNDKAVFELKKIYKKLYSFAELRRENEMLERLSRGFDAQRQFVGNAAHELRTPLTLLQTQLELFPDEHPDIPPESAAFLAALQDEVQRLSRLTHALLDMSDLQSVPRNDVILLSPMIDEVFADLAPLAERNGISLSREGENITVVGSDMLLCRMFSNLVENAVKYNHPGGMVKVDVQQRDRQAVIHVADTGRGIPQEFWQSIFQPFFRVDKSLSRELGGAGLGLPLVWEIARLHGGRVWVEESNDNGSALAVTLLLSASITDTVRR